MINKIILEILKNRGMDNTEEIEEFLSPLPKRTYDPFLLLNMEESVNKILYYISINKKICLYGDYDADGITSISILYYVLKHLTNNLVYFVPNRFSDGYGLNKKSLESLKNDGVDLVLTVDCGITAVEEVKFCEKLGMDIIITDHHTPHDIIPETLIINPKQKNCSYPFKELAGCGVAFKLAQGIIKSSNLDKSVLNHILDIVAIGTIGDIVPLIDENRTIVKYGLRSINAKKKKGLKALANLLGRKQFDSQSISFAVVPPLNAAGRINSAETGVKLFASESDEEALSFAKELIKLNLDRKSIQNNLFIRTKKVYEEMYKDFLFPFIHIEHAHEGVTGIVAGKLKDYCKKPVALITKDHNGMLLKGTSRSIGNIDIYSILSEANEYGLFERFGGHKGACGFSIKEENLAKVIKVVEDKMKNIPNSEFCELINYDYILNPSDISIHLAKELEIFEPTGHLNPKPIFKIENIKVTNILYMGKNKEHIKLTCNNDNTTFEALAFNYANLTEANIIVGKNYNIYGSININIWNNKESAQIIVTLIDQV